MPGSFVSSNLFRESFNHSCSTKGWGPNLFPGDLDLYDAEPNELLWDDVGQPEEGAGVAENAQGVGHLEGWVIAVRQAVNAHVEGRADIEGWLATIRANHDGDANIDAWIVAVRAAVNAHVAGHINIEDWLARFRQAHAPAEPAAEPAAAPEPPATAHEDNPEPERQDTLAPADLGNIAQ